MKMRPLSEKARRASLLTAMSSPFEHWVSCSFTIRRTMARGNSSTASSAAFAIRCWFPSWLSAGKCRRVRRCKSPGNLSSEEKLTYRRRDRFVPAFWWRNWRRWPRRGPFLKLGLVCGPNKLNFKNVGRRSCFVLYSGPTREREGKEGKNILKIKYFMENTIFICIANKKILT